MAVIIDTKRFKAAVKARPESKTRLAVLSGTCPDTFNRITAGSSQLRLNKIGEVAEFFGLDTIVLFQEKAPKKAKGGKR